MRNPWSVAGVREPLPSISQDKATEVTSKMDKGANNAAPAKAHNSEEKMASNKWEYKAEKQREKTERKAAKEAGRTERVKATGSRAGDAITGVIGGVAGALTSAFVPGADSSGSERGAMVPASMAPSSLAAAANDADEKEAADSSIVDKVMQAASDNPIPATAIGAGLLYAAYRAMR